MSAATDEALNQTLKNLALNVNSSVRVYEKRQIEATFAFGLKSQEDIEAEVDDHTLPKAYQVDAYFVFPPQMNVSPESYPIEKFYRDLKSYISFREPRLSYNEMIGKGGTSDDAPISVIRKYIESMRQGTIAGPPDAAIEEARLFGCAFYSYFTRRTTKLADQLERHVRRAKRSRHRKNEKVHTTLSLVAKTVMKGHRLLTAWRELERMANDLPENFLVTLRDELAIVHEYCYYIFRDGVFNLLKALMMFEDFRDFPEGNRLRMKLMAMTRYSRIVAKHYDFWWLDSRSDRKDRERFLFWRGILKRRVWSSLYLNTRTKPLFSVQRQLGAMIAAAFAGAWAVTIELFIRLNAKIVNPTSLRGWSLVLIVAILTFAYVLKDRIKELGRGYFRGGFLIHIPDNSEKVFFRTHMKERPYVAVGTAQETASYVPFARLPRDILGKLQEFDFELSEEHSSPRNVIYYRKRFFLDYSALSYLKKKVTVVHDMVRLNISSFLSGLDVPTHRFLVQEKNGKIEEVLSTKVYYVDLVLKINAMLQDHVVTPAQYKYFRLVLTKKGLLRIEALI